MNTEPKVEDLLATIRKAIDNDLGDLGSPPTSSYAANSMSSQSKGTVMRGAMREMRVSMEPDYGERRSASDEIAQLRNRISKNRITEGFAQPVPPKLNTTPKPIISSQPRTGFAGILGGDVPAPRPLAREAAPPPRHYAPQALPLRPAQDYETDYAAGDDVRWQAEEADLYETPQHYQAEPQYEQQEYAEEAQSYPPAIVSPDTANAANAAFNQLAETLMARAMGERSVEDLTKELLRSMLKTWLDDNLPSLVERLVREEIERVARRGR